MIITSRPKRIKRTTEIVEELRTTGWHVHEITRRELPAFTGPIASQTTYSQRRFLELGRCCNQLSDQLRQQLGAYAPAGAGNVRLLGIYSIACLIVGAIVQILITIFSQMSYPALGEVERERPHELNLAEHEATTSGSTGRLRG